MILYQKVNMRMKVIYFIFFIKLYFELIVLQSGERFDKFYAVIENLVDDIDDFRSMQN